MSKAKLSLGEVLAYVGSIPAGRSLPTIEGQSIRKIVKVKSGFLKAVQDNAGEVVLENQKSEIGISNIEGNKVPTKRKWTVVGFRWLFDTTAGNGALGQEGLKSMAFKSEAPVCFKNGLFSIAQEGDNVCTEITGTAATNWRASTSNDDDFEATIPFDLRATLAYSLKMLLVGVVSVDAAYKLELDIIETVE